MCINAQGEAEEQKGGEVKRSRLKLGERLRGGRGARQHASLHARALELRRDEVVVHEESAARHRPLQLRHVEEGPADAQLYDPPENR